MSRALLISEHIETRYGGDLDRIAPRLTRVIIGEEGVSGDLSEVEATFFSSDLYPDRALDYMLALAEAPRLGWLHSFSAGVDHPAFLELMDRGVCLSHSAGCNAVPIAHTVLLYILALSRDFPRWLDNAKDCCWQPHQIEEVTGTVLAVIGMGNIGTEVAALGKAFAMQVIGMRRSPTGDEPVETWSIGRLHELLAKADYVVLCLPLNDQSRRLLDARALAQMKPGARLINIGRGELVEEPALVDALANGRIAGAALDVFESEPLPADSPLWTMDNVIVTPHNAGQSQGSADRASEMFLDNLGRYLGEQPLFNEVRASPVDRT